jgi:hypothetical protein
MNPPKNAAGPVSMAPIGHLFWLLIADGGIAEFEHITGIGNLRDMDGSSRRG